MQNRGIVKGFQKLPSGTLKDLLFTMIKIRKAEEEIVKLYPEQEMRCPVHLCIGQEAVPAAVCKNLKTGDIIFASHRSHGYYIAQGGSIRAMLAELYGKASGCTKGKGGSQHLSAPEVGLLGSSAIVAGTVPIAAGAALSMVMRHKKSVVVAAFGDGAMDQGVLYESLNFAVLKKLPLIFICENNLYATHAHQSLRQSKDNIFEKAEAFGACGERVDGNNVVDVFHACSRAVQRARSGKGPSLIECRTYRWLEHVGPNYDYNLGYRSKKELREWMQRCPIQTFETLLLKKRLIRKQGVSQEIEKIVFEIREAVYFAKTGAFPPEGELLKDVYCI